MRLSVNGFFRYAHTARFRCVRPGYTFGVVCVVFAKQGSRCLILPCGAYFPAVANKKHSCLHQHVVQRAVDSEAARFLGRQGELLAVKKLRRRTSREPEKPCNEQHVHCSICNSRDYTQHVLITSMCNYCCSTFNSRDSKQHAPFSTCNSRGSKSI